MCLYKKILILNNVVFDGLIKLVKKATSNIIYAVRQKKQC
jgi:hypothetical protein